MSPRQKDRIPGFLHPEEKLPQSYDLCQSSGISMNAIPWKWMVVLALDAARLFVALQESRAHQALLDCGVCLTYVLSYKQKNDIITHLVSKLNFIHLQLGHAY